MKLSIAALIVLMYLVVSLTSFMPTSAQEPTSTPFNAPGYRLTDVIPESERVSDVLDAVFNPAGRLFVVGRRGKIWIVENGQRLTEPFLDVSDLLHDSVRMRGTEVGLHGLAFDPNYAENGAFYITYEARGGNMPYITLARYRVSADDPNRADRDSEQILIRAQKTFYYHTMAQLLFGPDGYLYVGVGDGGADDFGNPDPFGTGQRTNDIFASVLRIDVSGDSADYAIPPDNPFADVEGAAGEVWVYGLRNPSRFSFDRETGDLYIGDVGVDHWEEINIVPAGSGGGQNFGWSYYEGPETPPNHGRSRYSALAPRLPPATDVVWPALVYPHEGGNCAVIGGFVYRGEALPDLRGTYLYGDVCSGRIWGARLNEQGQLVSNALLFDTDHIIGAFAEDAHGELYVVNYDTGQVLKLEADGE